MRLFFILLSALLLGPAISCAQSPKEPPRSLRFYYAGFSTSGDEADPHAAFLLKNGKETVALELHANAFSELINYAGTPPVRLFREHRTETGVEREDLGELSFPPTWKGVLFIVTHNPGNTQLPFRFYPIEYWAPAVPDEHLRILNLCPYPLAAKIGANQAAVGARSTQDVALPAGRPDISLRLVAQRENQWERILSTGIVRPEQNKFLLLVFPQPNGATRVHILTDLPQPPSPVTIASNHR